MEGFAMNRIKNRITVFLLCICILGTTIGAGPDGVAASTPSVGGVMTVTIGKPKTIEVKGSSITSVKFSSSKKSVAKVDKKGKVTGVKYGSCYIKVTVNYDDDGDSEKIVLKKKITVVKKSGFSAAKVYKKIMAKKKSYPEGKTWTNANSYSWKAVPRTYYSAYGCAAFACIMSDAAFGKKTVAKLVKKPSANRVRVGDILRVDGDAHSVIVLKVEPSYFVIAEGNFNSSIHWGRKISKKEKIDYLYTRYEGK